MLQKLPPRLLVVIPLMLPATELRAQTVQLECVVIGVAPYAYFITINYSTRRLTVDTMDQAGKVILGPANLQNLAATVTNERVVATARWSNAWSAWTLNRYSGVVRTNGFDGTDIHETFTRPCTRRERGPPPY
jgi:hypothetical protein